MKTARIVVFSLLAFILFVSFAFAEDDKSSWKKIKEEEGIISHSRTTSLSPINEIKSVGIIDAPVAVVEAVLRDIPAQSEYMFMCVEAYRLVLPKKENGKDNFYVYNRTGMPWPVNDRDFVVNPRLMIDKSSGILYVIIKAVSSSYKKADNIVRIPLGFARYVLTPVGNNRTEMLYQILADPGGNLPAVLVNMMTKNIAHKTVANIRKLTKNDKYKNATEIITTTPYQEPED